MKKIKNFFNLIEITLALAVVAIGISGIMALFPVALDATKNAIGDNYAADAADQLLHYIAQACKNDWNTVNSLPAYVPATSPPPPSTITDTTIETADGWSSVGGNLYVKGTLYGIKQTSPSGAVDFKAHLQVWKSQISNTYWTGGGSGSTTIDYSKAARINLEVSWPIENDYANREKRYFSIEVYNPD